MRKLSVGFKWKTLLGKDYMNLALVRRFSLGLMFWQARNAELLDFAGEVLLILLVGLTYLLGLVVEAQVHSFLGLLDPFSCISHH